VLVKIKQWVVVRWIKNLVSGLAGPDLLFGPFGLHPGIMTLELVLLVLQQHIPAWRPQSGGRGAGDAPPKRLVPHLSD